MLKAISLSHQALALLKGAWIWLAYYRVGVLWEGNPQPEWKTAHYAKTFGEAMDWAAQYPHEGVTVIVGKRTKLLAARGRW
jgi:hypothetical protein